MKVLIVDSMATRRHAVQNLLFAVGFDSRSVVSNGTALKTLALLNGDKFRCVFLFAAAEAYDWLGLLREIREIFTQEEMGVILMSLEPTRELVMAAYEAGANGVLKYPCTSSDIENVLELIGISLAELTGVKNDSE